MFIMYMNIITIRKKDIREYSAVAEPPNLLR